MPEINRPDLVTDEAYKVFKDLKADVVDLKSSLDEIRSSSKSFSDAISNGNTTSSQLKETVQGLSAEQKALLQVQNQIAVQVAKQSDAYQTQLAILKDNQAQLKQKTELGNKEAISVTAQNSSINQLNSALQINRQAYANLTTEQQRQSAQGQQLLKVINDQDKSFKSLQQSIGKNQAEVGNYREAIEKAIPALSIFGENGIRVGEIFESIAKAATSGFALVSAAIGVAAISIKEFFGRTVEGQLQQEILLDQAEIRWEQLKNRAATLGQQILNFSKKIADAAEANEEAKEVHRKQRYATATEDQKKLMDLEEDQIKRQHEITLEREELLKEEIIIISQHSKSQLEAALLLEAAYGRGNESLKERFEAAVKADSILRKQNAEDINLAQNKAELFEKDLKNKKGSLGLTLEEQKQVAQTFSDVVQLSAQFELSSRRRIRLIATLGKELDDLRKKESQAVDFKEFEKDWQDMLNAIKALNASDEKDKKDKTDQEKKNEEDLTKLLENQEKQRTSNELREGETRWENYKKAKKKEEDLLREKLNLEKELALQTTHAIVSIINSQYQSEEQNLHHSLDILQEKYNEEINLAGNNSIAKAQIDAQYQKDQARIHKQIAELKRKEAIFERAAAVLDVTIKTAQAIAASELQASILASNPITAALAPEALAQIPIEIAIGAAQIAAILAKPIPQYFEGAEKGDHPGGLAIVGEQGIELIKTPSDQLLLSPSRATLIDLPAGSEVIPNPETMRRLAMAGMNQSANERIASNFNNELLNEVRGLKEITSKNKPKNIRYSRVGAMVYVAMGEKGKYMNRIRGLSMGKWV